jgi:hypothetical protein
MSCEDFLSQLSHWPSSSGVYPAAMLAIAALILTGLT